MFKTTYILKNALTLSDYRGCSRLFPTRCRYMLGVGSTNVHGARLCAARTRKAAPISVVGAKDGKSMPTGKALIPVTTRTFRTCYAGGTLGCTCLPTRCCSLPGRRLRFSTRRHCGVVGIILGAERVSGLRRDGRKRGCTLPLLLRKGKTSMRSDLLVVTPSVGTPSLRLADTKFMDTIRFASGKRTGRARAIRLTLPAPGT